MTKYRNIVLSFGAIMLIVGCSAKTEVGIENIQKNKHTDLKADISIAGNEYDGFRAYLNSDNELKYLCHGKSFSDCNYKHEGGETFFVNSNSYYPNISPSTSGVQCGKGSLFGWLAIFMMKPFGIEDHTSKHASVCNNSFTQIDSTQLGERIVFGLLTFGTPLVTGGNMHTVKFDGDKFKDAVFATNIASFKNQLFEVASQYDIDGGFDVIYLKEGNVEDNLLDKYNSLLLDTSKKAGVIFLEKNTNRLLAINVFNKYKKENIIKSISLEIEDVLANIAKDNQYLLNYDDIIKYIPQEISLPEIPAIPKLVKDEFENKSAFNKRVKNAVEERERRIRSLQRQYSLDVFERNNYISNLQNSYKQYLENEADSKNKFLTSIKKNIPLLSKVLFLEHTSGYLADNFKYNAEEEKLYFTIYSNNKSFSQEVVSEIPPKTAKQIKLNKTFKIIPEIEAMDNKIELSGFNILETASNDSFRTKYTNVNFKPEKVMVSVLGMNESIQKNISKHFEKYIQKDTPIIDTSKKEIWYIDIAERINAKIPKWFATPISDEKVIGYGEGKTLVEAKSNARNDLALMVKVKVDTIYSGTQSVNNFSSFSEIKEQTKQSSNVELSSNNYKLFKQDSMDGRWYVGLEYIR